MAALTTLLICSAVCMALILWCNDRHVLFISTTPGGRPLEYQGCRKMWGTLMRLSGSAAPRNPHLAATPPTALYGFRSHLSFGALSLTATANSVHQRSSCRHHALSSSSAASLQSRLLVCRNATTAGCLWPTADAVRAGTQAGLLVLFQVAASTASSDQSQQHRPCQ